MKRQSLSALGFLAFPLAVLLVFTLIPTVAGLLLSLFRWDGSGLSTVHFAGLRNFRDLAADPQLASALRNTLYFTIATVPLTVILSFFLAVALHARWFVGRTLVRTLFFLPTVVSIVAIGFVWRWILSDQGGLIPAVLRQLGFHDLPNLLQDPPWSMRSIIAVSIWRSVGFNLVLYLAALANVNESLHEAAEVDGASRWRVLRHITWPQVAPMTAFLLVTGAIAALQVFDIIWALGAGAETDHTRVLNLYVYREFQQSRLGYAAAIAAVIFALTLLVTAAQLVLYRRSEP